MKKDPVMAKKIFYLICWLLISLLVISFVACQEKPKTLLLMSRETKGIPQRGLLIREIFRQAMLIAGRDEMGLSTRDMTLREPFPQELDDSNRPLDMVTLVPLTKDENILDIEVYRGTGKSKEVILQKYMEWPESELNYTKLIELAEKLSRNDFIHALEKAGFSGKPNTRVASISLPPNTEKNLQQMSFISQYAALREIHTLIKKRGESPELLAGLVRGYANLGKLTEFYWNAIHKVFKARALLYAERMVVADPNSPWALWHRAYARALVGFHGAALSDLDEADRHYEALSKAQEKTIPSLISPPAWIPVIDAYCHYDDKRLAAVAAVDKQNREIALLLQFLAVEKSSAESLILDKGRKMLESSPACSRVINGLCYVEQIGNKHWVTTYGPAVLTADLPVRLGEILGIPSNVKKLIKGSEGNSNPSSLLSGLENMTKENQSNCFPFDQPAYIKIPKVAEALIESGAVGKDIAEPSWSVLGRMIQELVFTQIHQRAYFMKFQWGVSIDDFLQQSLPLIDDHPYKAVIETYSVDAEGDRERYAALLKDVKVVDVSFTMVSLINAMRDARINVVLSLDAVAKSDLIASDLESLVVFHDSWWKNSQNAARTAHQLYTVSPHSPIAIAYLILYDWTFAQQHITEWEETHGQYPLFVLALANHYVDLGQYEKAEPYLKRRIQISPDLKPYQILASVYKKQEQMEKWREVLEGFLEQSGECGLDGDRIQVELADYYMDRKEWTKALPYAEAAAQSWAGWAMLCATKCYEGMGKWDQAELWIRRISERYEDSKIDWYLWCKRTGQGDIEAAREFFLQHLEKTKEHQTENDLESTGIFYLIENQPGKALEIFQRAFTNIKEPYVGLHIVILADQLNDIATRDATLKKIIERGKLYKDTRKPLPQAFQIAELFEKCLSSGTQCKLDYKAVDKIIEEAPSDENTNLLYFVGRFLERHATADQALKYLKRATGSRNIGKWNYALAYYLLRSRGISIQD